MTKIAEGAETAALFEYKELVDGSVEALQGEDFIGRLWKKDPTLWGGGDEDRVLIENSLGWLEVGEEMAAEAGELMAFGTEVKALGIKDVVLLGMGGSSLGPEVLRRTFGSAEGFPTIHVLDSTDPGSVAAVRDAVTLESSVFIVASKSGTTIEPLSFFEYFYSLLKDIVGESAGEHFIAITDPGTPLAHLARNRSFLRTFVNRADIGGRFSVLSYFGLVPAALIGIDLKRLLSSTAEMAEACRNEDYCSNPGLMLGAAMGTLGTIDDGEGSSCQKGGMGYVDYGDRVRSEGAGDLGAGVSGSGEDTGTCVMRDKVTFLVDDALGGFGLWAEQLIAESTGKRGAGLIPIGDEALLKAEEYSGDRLFAEVSVSGGSGVSDGGRTSEELRERMVPVLSSNLNDIYDLGGEFLRWEVAVAVAGRLIGINPFDQPDVELAKVRARECLKVIEDGEEIVSGGVDRTLDDMTITFTDTALELICAPVELFAIPKGPEFPEDGLRRFLHMAVDGDYMGLLGYLNSFDSEIEGELRRGGELLLKASSVALQTSFGPRYLHSTGQLHKGGPESGIFIIICHGTDPEDDIKVPGSDYTFSSLETAQAYGDFAALGAARRRGILINLPDGKASTLRALFDRFERLLG